VIAVVLRANHFMKRDFCWAMVTPLTLNGVPRHREGAGVLDADIDFQRLAALDELEAFDDVKLGGGWLAIDRTRAGGPGDELVAGWF
jgi:hypothetical protein